MADDSRYRQLRIPGLDPMLDLAEAELRARRAEEAYHADGRDDPLHPLRGLFTGLRQSPAAQGAQEAPATPEGAPVDRGLDKVRLKQCARARALEYGAEALQLQREIARLQGLEASCRARYFRELAAAEYFGGEPSSFAALGAAA